MATSSNSYLQTLPKEQAIEFVAVLQKVKEHLNQELQWINDQVQQKTTQLEGIETLLSEASTLGLLGADASSPSTSAKKSAPASSANATDTNGNGTSSVTPPATSQPSASTKDAAPAETADSAPSKAAAPAAASSTRQTRDTKKNSTSLKTSRTTKKAAPKKASASKAKQAKSSASSAVKDSAASDASGFQQFLQSRFQNKSLTDAVSEILDRSKTSLDADDIIDKLYQGLPDDDYKRVKHSISNILSMGKSKNKWKSTGRGLYSSHSVAG